MTQLDVLYRYGTPPTEQAMLALSKVRDVYGIRGLRFEEAGKTVRVEYDASRLSAATVHQLLRRAGLDIVETVSLIPEPEDIAPPAPVQPSVAKAGL
jgi:hypothetical protein